MSAPPINYAPFTPSEHGALNVAVSMNRAAAAHRNCGEAMDQQRKGYTQNELT